MSAANSLNLEDVIGESIPGEGYREDWAPGLGGWRSLDWLTLTASTAPAIAAVATNMPMMLWDAALLVTDVMTYTFTMPRQFAEMQDDLQIVCAARKSANTNTDLALRAQIYWFTPGTVNIPNQQDVTGTQPTNTEADAALSSLTTPALARLSAGGGATTNTIGFATYNLDIGRRLVAESKRIQAGDVCTITFGPSETCGDDLRTSIPVLRWRRHAGLYYSLNAPGSSPR